MIVSYFDSVVVTGNLPIVIFLKWAFPGLFFNLLSSFQTQIKILQQMNVKNVHPVYGAGIRTHNLWNMSLLR